MNIQTIAELCGVSKTTVSRILNNRPDVKAETRDKVIQVMNELGFRPTLGSNRNETIGMLMPPNTQSEFIGELFLGITETAFAAGLTLELIPSRAANADDIAHFCRSNSLCGMIVLNPPYDSPLPEALVKQNIPHVIIAASYRDSEISFVDVDNYGGCEDAVNHLIQEGHRRIALLHHRRNIDRLTNDRIDGYLAAHANNGLEPDPSLMVENTADNQGFETMLQRLFQRPDPPTAIFCTVFRTTLNTLHFLQRIGIRVPEDVSLVGFGDYEISPLMKPPLTTVFQPIRELGRTAVLTFEKILHQPGYEKQQVILPTRLVVRQSTLPIRTNP